MFFSCKNVIRKLIDVSEKPYFVGKISLKRYLDNINSMYDEVNKTYFINEKTKNIVSSFITNNSLNVSKYYLDYIIDYKEKSLMIPNELAINQVFKNE